MAVTTTTGGLAAILKRLYPKGRVENLVYQDNPLLAMIPKRGKFGGSALAVPVRYADTMGRAAGFSQAQTNAQNGTGFGAMTFLVTRVKDYQVYSLENEAIMAAEEDMMSFLQSLDTEVESALNNMSRSMAIQLYRDGVGEIGQVAVGGVSSTVITLANANDITNFEVGQVIVCAATRTGALRNSGTGQTITAVDRDLGTVTVSANTDSIAAGDYLYMKGDRQAAAITANTQWLRMSGLEAWNPATAPAASESFFGQDRSVDTARLGGIRLDISAYNPEEGLVRAINRVCREGSNPKHLFVNFADLTNIQNSLGAKAVTEYVEVGNIGFSSIRVTGPKGDVRIFADQNAPSGVGRLLQLDTWKLNYLGELVNILDRDGSRLSREASADRFEGRMAFYGNVVCYAPGKNARLVLPS